MKMKEKGFEVYPINPGADNIAGTPCFRNVASLPLNVHSLIILTKKNQTRDVVADAIAKGIDNIWIQQMCDTPESIERAKSRPINLVTKECIFMHVDPVEGIHKFHRTLRRFFGFFPK
jgi:hypothetical protein